MSLRYKESESMLVRATDIIPLGSQTFSKSKVQFPYGVSPYFIEKGKGSRVWDIDGNEYIDFVNGLLAVFLGYCDPDVDAAVQKQLTQGVIFSLPHKLETEVAEKIIAMVPCAEMVRFGKNGSDATSGAVRIARAYTGADYIAVCGYHGWQDWYIGSTTRSLGVPQTTKDLTLKFQYNDIASLEALFNQYPNQIAAVILEPMNIEFPKEDFLKKVKELTHKNNAVLIFDEMITGFRFAKGGAQELFGVIPDLVALGKGMANGFPLSVVAGKREIMKLMEDVFFSFTFGGETLSLAAAKAVLDKISSQPIIETMHQRGNDLIVKLESLLKKHELNEIIQIAGHPVWSFLIFKDSKSYSSWDIKTFWMQEILARGIISFGSHNISYAHSNEDVEQILIVYDEVFERLTEHLNNNSLLKALHCEVLQPLFKVR
ncbi:MAG: aminotransferase class III [Gammaproteobacteria bacterium RIFCSPHIGHO2_12_FULL_35_23]|nr:MAG: aminotransferase class III [Gammaproteobacteria bacterium RIFCSPHIGHO2_12_FULL_35_23]